MRCTHLPKTTLPVQVFGLAIACGGLCFGIAIVGNSERRETSCGAFGQPARASSCEEVAWPVAFPEAIPVQRNDVQVTTRYTNPYLSTPTTSYTLPPGAYGGDVDGDGLENQYEPYGCMRDPDCNNNGYGDGGDIPSTPGYPPRTTFPATTTNY